MQEIIETIQRVCKELFGVDIEAELTRPDEQFGDYATNVAMQLAGRLNKSPRELAERLAERINQDITLNARVAGPGFINIHVSDSRLWHLAQVAPRQVYAGQTIVAEYSDPNPLKPLHAGHLYTTLVGDSIAKLLEQAGAHVVRVNYGGDVGLHVGKSMWAILKTLGGERPEKLQDIAETERPDWLGERYVEGNNAYEDDEAARAEIIEVNKRVYELHAAGDKESAFARIYWTVRQWSYDYFATLYGQLKVTPFDRFLPESEVAQLGVDTVRTQLQNGVYEESDGAVIFRGENYGLHTRVFINSAGLPTYEAKDVGLLLRKWEDYHFDLSLVITANEQAQYYQVMLKSVEQFNPEPVKRSRHLTHGVVKLHGGVKMSSRKGNVVTALDILDAAREAGEKSEATHSKDSILAAVKYAFAKNRIGGDIIYDPAESVALEGNSGPYLQYAHARARSILNKAGERAGDLPPDLRPDERSLLRKLGEYAETVDKAVSELMPHHICTYLYELAQSFNRFYEHNRVIGDEREALRLQLVKTYADTLKNGLMLLNIPAPERM
jgi:arginyl-tRNA synthetase